MPGVSVPATIPVEFDAKAAMPEMIVEHPICRVTDFQILSPFTLRVEFDDGAEQVIDFRPVLGGELLGPLRDLALFEQVRLDPEVHTLVWPNGADFDPATPRDWPEHVQTLAQRAKMGTQSGLMPGK